MPTENRSSTEMVSVPHGWLYRINPDVPGSNWQFTQDAEHAERLARSENVEYVKIQAEQHHGEPAPWSPVKPSGPGAYWVRGNGLDQDALIQVIDDHGELRCNLHQRTTESDFGWGYAVADLNEGFEWRGPLYTHADAGEVERLRNCLRTEVEAGDSWKREVQELRAQLAERDALLFRMAYYLAPALEANAPYMSAETMHDALSALNEHRKLLAAARSSNTEPVEPEDRKFGSMTARFAVEAMGALTKS